MSEKKRILIIDDEPTALELLRRIVSSVGYDTVLAANGEEGLERFQEQPCDLVITDMVMPVKDGLQTILDLRADFPDLPVIAISGGGAISKERYLAVASYLDRVITVAKPFSINSITDAIEKLLLEASEEQ